MGTGSPFYLDRVNQFGTGHAAKISFKIINKVKSSICKISYLSNNGHIEGTGFFIKLNDCKCIMTNYHVISELSINKIINIGIYGIKTVQIKLNGKYVKFMSPFQKRAVRNFKIFIPKSDGKRASIMTRMKNYIENYKENSQSQQQ